MKPSTGICLAAVLVMTACATNPVTGKRELNFMSEAQEVQLGQQSDPEIRGEMGEYPNPALQQYVRDVGMRLAKASERPDLQWHFAVVDVPAVNAFALPGGYVYITRGLLAHLDNEAEMAGVLGHEIGHVTARHSARNYTRTATANIGVVLASIFVPKARPFMGAVQAGLGLAFLKYDRDQELQADSLGTAYVAKVGWAPSGMSGVLQALGRIEAASDSRGVPNWLSTHPQPADRVAKLTQTVQTLESARPASEWSVNHDPYWQRLDGLIYGDNPREGFVRGREFIHPDMRFRLTFPEGWKIANGKRQVSAAPPGVNDVALVLQLVESPVGASLEDVAVGSMKNSGFSLVNGESTRLNSGLPVYHGIYGGQTEDGGVVQVEAAHISHGGQVFLLAGLSSQARFRQAQPFFVEAIRSFATAPAGEMDRIKPNRLAFSTVRGGDTWETIAARSGGAIRASDLAVVNGFAPNSRPPEGRRIKTVIPGE